MHYYCNRTTIQTKDPLSLYLKRFGNLVHIPSFHKHDDGSPSFGYE